MLRRWIAAALIWGTAGPAVAADGFEITAIRAHLFYERSGQLSEDIVVSRPVLWNTIIGEGSVSEPASDVLIVVEMRSEGDALSETPLVIEASFDRDGDRVRQSRSFDYLYTEFGENRIARAMWVENVTCEPLEIVATHGPDRKAAQIPFHCGE